MVRKPMLLLLTPLLASCMARIELSPQGPMQPQAVYGPCQVERFFLLGLRSVPVRMTVANTGQACSFILINPALNVVVSAALLTRAPSRGQAAAGVISTGRQAAVWYTPAPGYVGPDQFSVSLEPDAVGLTVDVLVQPPR